MIKSMIKLRFGKWKIRRNYFESCFGSSSEKYDEFFKWLHTTTGVDGDILEFGVAKGGTTCLMAESLKHFRINKIIHSFDSFQGFDEKEFDKCLERRDVNEPHQKKEFRTEEHTLHYVRSKLKAFELDQYVNIYPGFFQETLPAFLGDNQERKFCFALVDCDLAESVRFCAETIYSRMSTNATILFDDYGSVKPEKSQTSFSPGVRRVVDSFVQMYPSKEHGYRNGLYYFVK